MSLYNNEQRKKIIEKEKIKQFKILQEEIKKEKIGGAVRYNVPSNEDLANEVLTDSGISSESFTHPVPSDPTSSGSIPSSSFGASANFDSLSEDFKDHMASGSLTSSGTSESFRPYESSKSFRPSKPSKLSKSSYGSVGKVEVKTKIRGVIILNYKKNDIIKCVKKIKNFTFNKEYTITKEEPTLRFKNRVCFFVKNDKNKIVLVDSLDFKSLDHIQQIKEKKKNAKINNKQKEKKPPTFGEFEDFEKSYWYDLKTKDQNNKIPSTTVIETPFTPGIESSSQTSPVNVIIESHNTDGINDGNSEPDKHAF